MKKFLLLEFKDNNIKLCQKTLDELNKKGYKWAKHGSIYERLDLYNRPRQYLALTPEEKKLYTVVVKDGADPSLDIRIAMIIKII